MSTVPWTYPVLVVLVVACVSGVSEAQPSETELHSRLSDLEKPQILPLYRNVIAQAAIGLKNGQPGGLKPASSWVDVTEQLDALKSGKQSNSDVIQVAIGLGELERTFSISNDPSPMSIIRHTQRLLWKCFELRTAQNCKRARKDIQSSQATLASVYSTVQQNIENAINTNKVFGYVHAGLRAIRHTLLGCEHVARDAVDKDDFDELLVHMQTAADILDDPTNYDLQNEKFVKFRTGTLELITPIGGSLWETITHSGRVPLTIIGVDFPPLQSNYFNSMLKPHQYTTRYSNGVVLPAIAYRLQSSVGFQGEYDRALKAGIKHFDLPGYFPDAQLLYLAMKKANTTRNDIYITTRLRSSEYSGVHAARKAVLQQMWGLQSEYIDCVVVQQTSAGDVYSPAYKAVEHLVAKGLVRSIGIQDVTSTDLDALLAKAKTPPHTVHNQFNVYAPGFKHLQGQNTLKQAKQHKIGFVGHYLASRSDEVVLEPLQDPYVMSLAAAAQLSPLQLLVQWAMQMGIGVVLENLKFEQMSSLFSSPGQHPVHLDKATMDTLAGIAQFSYREPTMDAYHWPN